MNNFTKRFSNLFGRQKPGDYGAQKEKLASSSKKKRMTLAQSTETNKEILYYLAESDPDPRVRKAVVENESMPVQVTPKLAQDADEDVRLALARRLIGLLPELSEDRHSQLYAFAVQSLGTLALDEVLKIRVALSSTLKDYAFTPPKVAGQLARDVEQEVSEPILRFCAALSDEDLIDILKGHPASWAVQAIAGRRPVSEDVSEAVIGTEDVPGGRVLIENETAQITESLLQTIVEKSRSCPEWQKPMAGRAHLPPSIAVALAEFVDSSVRELLLSREDFDDALADEIAEVFHRRMKLAGAEDQTGESAYERLQKIESEGRLNEETLSDALGMRDYALVNAAIAKMAGTDLETVTRIFETRQPKSVVALAWRAGLSMRMALQLQKDVAHVSYPELLYPRGGTDYPLSEDEINWQLDFLGIKAA